jgi:hypothetical protein
MKPTVDQTTKQQAEQIATSSNALVNTGALSKEEIASRLPSYDASIRRTFEASLHARTQSQWDALVETHCAVNRGARAASNLLLSLRGGISPKLASAALEGDKQPSREEIAFRRTLIALSYLTVEDTLNAPHDLRIGGLVDFQNGEELAGRLNDELQTILRARGESDEAIQEWLDDCSPALSAAVRDDAVWVNRAKGFDKLQERCGETLTSDEVWDLLQRVVGTPSEYFDFSGVDTGSEEEVAQREIQFEKDSDKIAIACQHWLGQRFGAGQGLDYKGLSTFYECLADSIAQGSPEATGEQIVREAATSAGLSLPQSLADGRAASEVASDLSDAWAQRHGN